MSRRHLFYPDTNTTACGQRGSGLPQESFAREHPMNKCPDCMQIAADDLPFRVGDSVTIGCNDEGFVSRRGTVTRVFPSGRCLVAVGTITILNLPPQVLTKHEVSD